MTKYFVRMFMIIPLLLGMSLWATHEPAPVSSTVQMEQPPRALEMSRRVDNRASRSEVRVPIQKPVDFSQPTLSPVPPPPKPTVKATPKVKKTAKPKPRQTTKASAKISKSAPGGVAACIRKYESGGNYRAQNPVSSASGAYQFIDSTWRSITGRSDRAKDAPPSVQDAAFFKLWNGGKGARHWVTAHKCGY